MDVRALSTIGIKIGGSAGAGIKSTGMLIGKTFARMGFNVFEYPEYPSLIRGGHNTEHITAGIASVHSQIASVHILLCLNEETFTRHQREVVDGGVVMMDKKSVRGEFSHASRMSILDVPLLDLARRSGGDIMANNVGVGAILACLGLPVDVTVRGIEEEFRSKKKEVADANITALRSGYDFVTKTYPDLSRFSIQIPRLNPSSRIFLTGNDAVGIGAIAAGIGLYSAYPMTPTSSLLHFMVEHQREFGYAVRQPEDEIAAANTVIGAMHMGVRAMCATSGGGFALMNETLALSGMIEEPFVVMLGMRPGPATGLPTWTEQGELQYAVHAGHGEFLRFVLAPGDPAEAFQLTAEAFNLAEKYQTPVIILNDKYLGESAMTVPTLPIDQTTVDRGEVFTQQQLDTVADYQRYALTECGVSPRTFPGMRGGIFVANSDEHEYRGLVDETSNIRSFQQEKRMRKFAFGRLTLPGPQLIGSPTAKKTVITWGSTKLPALHALMNVSQEKFNILHFTHLWPLNLDVVAASLSQLVSQGNKTLIAEGNMTGQLQSLLKEQFGFTPTSFLHRYDGRPIYPEQIKAKLDELI